MGGEAEIESEVILKMKEVMNKTQGFRVELQVSQLRQDRDKTETRQRQDRDKKTEKRQRRWFKSVYVGGQGRGALHLWYL